MEDYYERKKDGHCGVRYANFRHQTRQVYARLAELDCVVDKRMAEHTEFLQNDGDKINKNIIGNVLCLAVAGGLLTGSNEML